MFFNIKKVVYYLPTSPPLKGTEGFFSNLLRFVLPTHWAGWKLCVAQVGSFGPVNFQGPNFWCLLIGVFSWMLLLKVGC